MFLGFAVLALIERLVFRLILAQFISRFHQVIAQEVIALLAQSRTMTRPPETGVFGDGIFDIAQVLVPKPPTAFVPLLTGKEALQVTYLCRDTSSQDNAQAFDVDQVTDFRMSGLHLLGQTMFHLNGLLFQKGDVVEGQA